MKIYKNSITVGFSLSNQAKANISNLSDLSNSAEAVDNENDGRQFQESTVCSSEEDISDIPPRLICKL